MGNPFEFSVSLRVRHPTMDPSRISASLEMTPKYSWKVGEARKTPKGTPLDGNYPDSYCSFEIGKGADGELAECLRRAVSKLETQASFLRELRTTGGSTQFFCFWYPNRDTGEVFDVDLLLKMGALGVELGVNVYDDRGHDDA